MGKRKQRAFRSVNEAVKTLLPQYYEERVERKGERPAEVGTGLAPGVVARIKERLAKPPEKK